MQKLLYVYYAILLACRAILIVIYVTVGVMGGWVGKQLQKFAKKLGRKEEWW